MPLARPHLICKKDEDTSGRVLAAQEKRATMQPKKSGELVAELSVRGGLREALQLPVRGRVRLDNHEQQMPKIGSDVLLRVSGGH